MIEAGNIVQWSVGSGLPWRIGTVKRVGEYSAFVTWRNASGEASAWVMLHKLHN